MRKIISRNKKSNSSERKSAKSDNKKYLVMVENNKYEVKSKNDFSQKMQAILELYDDKEHLLNELVKFANFRLYSLKDTSRFAIDGDDLVLNIIEKLHTEKYK